MCGIMGAVAPTDVWEPILDGLRRLEYRGYDSAGIATLEGKGNMHRCRAEGKLGNLARKLYAEPPVGGIGIGHTRWATHGAPTEHNAHPHASDKVVLVHNGIIENFSTLRKELIEKGHKFESETDTEVIVHLVTDYLQQGLEPKEAVHKSLQQMEGAFALAMLFVDYPDQLIVAKRGSPLAIGHGDDAMYVGSDALALAPLTNRICYLQEGDWAVVTREGATVFDMSGAEVERPVRTVNVSGAMIGKGNHRHYMQKEIFEQPGVIGETLQSLLNPTSLQINLPYFPFDWDKVKRVVVIACGTSFYAGMVGRYWLEQYAGLPVEVDIASEFRYRTRQLEDDYLAIFISQSGETADTLAALRHVKEMGVPTLAVVNVPESSIAREADGVLQTLAGPEIGVASTKAFTTQLTVLAALSLALAHKTGFIDETEQKELAQALLETPAAIIEVLERDGEIEQLAQEVVEAQTMLYLGRGLSWPIAMEGALKLKEISYIHAEGFAAGEMKHGPIALIDETVPVVFVAPPDDLLEKTISNMQEVKARGGRVVLFTDKLQLAELADDKGLLGFDLPAIHPFAAPILYAVPVQQLAYHVAVLKGTDVDQPRNLAKSVTVE